MSENSWRLITSGVGHTAKFDEICNSHLHDMGIQCFDLIYLFFLLMAYGVGGLGGLQFIFIHFAKSVNV